MEVGQEHDLCEAIADSFVLADVSDEGGLADPARTDDREDLRFLSTMGLGWLCVQQEADDMLSLLLAAEHAVIQQEVHAVGLPVPARVAHQEQDQHVRIGYHGAQPIQRLA